jgi:hypothetical protein
MDPEPTKPERPYTGKAVGGRTMLVVTLLLIFAILALAFLAGPFGRELTIRQQPSVHWTTTDSR